MRVQGRKSLKAMERPEMIESIRALNALYDTLQRSNS